MRLYSLKTRMMAVSMLCCMGILCFGASGFSQDDKKATTASVIDSPKLEFVCELKINVGKPLQVGETTAGQRRIIPILGGTFKGPNMQGVILEGGADWQLIKKDGVAEIDARYTLQTDDSTLIYISNKGIRVASPEVLKKLSNNETVNPNEYYFRTIPVFETASEKYNWLTRSIFIAKGIRNPGNVVIQVWMVK